MRENKTHQISIFVLVFLACSVSSGRSQCLSANDTQIDENSVGDAVRSLIDSTNNFGIEMLLALGSDKSNHSDGLFFSPFSIWSALVVTYIGAKGRTEKEMQSVLGLGNSSKAVIWEAYRNLPFWYQLHQDFATDQTSYKLANRLFFQQDVPFQECMIDYLATEIKTIDFHSDPEAARESINKWVEDQTNQKIQELIPPGSLDSMTKMVIANAVYFKDKWLEQFNPKNTRRRRFTLPNREEIIIDMMTMRSRLLYGNSDELQCTALELPYSGNDLAMIILLPRNKFTGLETVSRLLTLKRLKNLIHNMYPREVLVSIPKFHIEDSFELAKTLNTMGMRSLFDSRNVDLSGFTGHRDLTVDSVHHKAFIDVNEEGTEAAAATAILASRTARPLGPASFIADRAFLFLIRDNFSNVILFMGTVTHPKYPSNQQTS